MGKANSVYIHTGEMLRLPRMQSNSVQDNDLGLQINSLTGVSHESSSKPVKQTMSLNFEETQNVV